MMIPKHSTVWNGRLDDSVPRPAPPLANSIVLVPQLSKTKKTGFCAAMLLACTAVGVGAFRAGEKRDHSAMQSAADAQNFATVRHLQKVQAANAMDKASALEHLQAQDARTMTTALAQSSNARAYALQVATANGWNAAASAIADSKRCVQHQSFRQQIGAAWGLLSRNMQVVERDCDYTIKYMQVPAPQ